jgi:hypothetical protein
MDEQLIERLEAEAKQLKSRLDHLRIERANNRLNFHQWREFFTTKEKLHAIYLKLRNPNALVVYDIKVSGFKLPPGANPKALTDVLDRRGFKWEIDFETRTVNFYRKYGSMTLPPRTYDVAVVKGSTGNATMIPSELKTPNALLNSVKGKLNDGMMVGEFKTRSGRTKLIGGQIETEKWLKKLAHEHGVEAVLLESRNIENGFSVKHEIKPDNLKVSRVTPYEAPSTKMFSSIRAAGRRIQRNLERANQRLARERANARKAMDPRGVNEKGTSNKLRAAEPSPTQSAPVPEVSKRQISPPDASGAKIPPGAGGSLDADDLSIRTSSSFLKNLSKGFVLEIIKGLVLNALIGPFERELGKVNLEQTIRSFQAFIMPQIEPVLRGELADTYEVIFNPDKRVWATARRYLLVWWYQYTEEQAFSIGDVAVWAYRFPEGFAEVFDSVEINPHGPYGTPFANFHTKRAYKGRTPSREEIKRNGKTYYRYSFTTAILVWDRDVAKLVWEMSKVSKAKPDLVQNQRSKVE